jgi:isocitrate dehydrogenase
VSLILIPPEGVRIIPNLATPDHPVIPFIEGDGIGADIAPVMRGVVDAAVAKAYGGGRQIHWMEIYCGEKARSRYGVALPAQTLDAMRECVVSIKGPLADRALDQQLREELNLYACVRPLRWLRGVPSPLKAPELIDMVIFRENTMEAGSEIELGADSVSARKLIEFLQGEMGVRQIRFPGSSSIGIRAVSREGTEQLVRKAIQYAIDHHRKSVTLVHKGTQQPGEDIVCVWAYQLAIAEFGGIEIDGGPSVQLPNGIVIKNVQSDAFLQQTLLRPVEYDVIVTLNLNGDYVSDSLAAEVGGIGMAPCAHLSENLACFEPTHGAVPVYAGQDKVNPSSLILSAEMMLRHLGWKEAADLIIRGLEGAIGAGVATCDLAPLITGATEVSCSGFARAVIGHM